ncbi:MAG: hypothetical protein OXG24_11730 [Gammaproteobacteria bacterium]|nr:hypothetical protein [Gammaproteobacteria bacterium]
MKFNVPFKHLSNGLLDIDKSLESVIPQSKWVLHVFFALFLLGVCACQDSSKSSKHVSEDLSSHADSNVTVRRENNPETNLLAREIESIEDFQDLTKFKSKFLRNTALQQRLLRSDERELVGLIAEARKIPRKSIREDVLQLTLARLATLNPMQALNQVEKVSSVEQNVFVRLIFEEWSLGDLDSAVNHASTLDKDKKMAALGGIMSVRDDLSEEQIREIAKRLGINDIDFIALASAASLNEAEPPEVEWEMLVNDEQSDLSQIESLIRTAEAWIERDGLDAIGQIYSMTTDWQILMPVLSSALDTIIRKDPETAYENALGLDFDTGEFIVRSIVQSWSTVDPKAAFDAVSSLELNSLRLQLQDSVIRTWGRKDPNDLLNAIEQLPESVKFLGREHAIVSLSRSAPKEAARLLGTLNVGRNGLSIARAIATNWSDQDPQAALDWVQTAPEAIEMQHTLLAVVLENLAKRDPNTAMDIALKQPLEPNQIGLEASVIFHLSGSDVQKAVETLSRVREGKTKQAAYITVGSQLIRNGEVQQALQLASQLHEAQRENYFTALIGSWAMSQPDELFERLNDLPNKTIRSHAASSLITINRFRKALSDDQIESLEDQLTEEDRLDLESGPVPIGY